MQNQSYAVGWITLALLNTGLAQTKGKSGLLWFCISLLLGPFATLLLVVVRDKDELSPEERERILKEMKAILDKDKPA